MFSITVIMSVPGDVCSASFFTMLFCRQEMFFNLIYKEGLR